MQAGPVGKAAGAMGSHATAACHSFNLIILRVTTDAAIEPVRLALCVTSLAPGGAERCLAEIAAGLDRTRFRPIVVSLAPLPQKGQPSVAGRIEQAGVEIHSLNVRGKWQAWSAVSRLTRLLKTHRPHIVQSFLFHANIVSRLAARRASVPRIVCGIRVAERRHRWYLWLDRLTAGRVDRQVCVSQAVADFSRERGRLPAQQLLVIPNGIDLSRYTGVTPANLTELSLPPGRRTIIHVGRLDPQKRIDWLLDLSPAWLRQCPQHDLLLVGDGPQRSDLVRQAKRLGIGERVHFVGWRSDVPPLLAASDALVLSSAWEGMPNVVLEAMASGLPMVATDVEGVREALGPDSAEQIVPLDNPHDFCQKLMAIAGDRKLAARLGERNRARVAAEFSLTGMIAKYEQLYLDLAGKRDI